MVFVGKQPIGRSIMISIQLRYLMHVSLMHVDCFVRRPHVFVPLYENWLYSHSWVFMNLFLRTHASPYTYISTLETPSYVYMCKYMYTYRHTYMCTCMYI